MRNQRHFPHSKLPQNRLKLLLILLTTSIFYLILHHRLISPLFQTHRTNHRLTIPTTTTTTSSTTTISHLFFAIASSSTSFPRRAPYFSLWHTPNLTRTVVFLDHPLPPQTSHLPPVRISGDTARFPYTFPRGFRSALRVARLVKEAVELHPVDVRWFVFGDDDTIFFVENLVRVLGKYDYEKLYYVGTSTESFEQSLNMGFNMAYGGGGFAVSAALGRVLATVLDSCLMRYPHLYGSDARISACVSELGVELTKEPGFHQLDVRGDLFGLLTAHPLSPLLSLHHLEIVDPIFPDMNQTNGLRHLFKAYHADPGRILQQTVCYDGSSNITISVSWGYAVQVYEGNLPLPYLLAAQRTFTPWRRRGANIPRQYAFDTRDYPKDHCERPIVFFLKDVASGTGRVWSRYSRHTTRKCLRSDEIKNLKDIKVFVKKLQRDAGQVIAPRRQCCDVVHPFGKSMAINIRDCGIDELIAMNP